MEHERMSDEQRRIGRETKRIQTMKRIEENKREQERVYLESVRSSEGFKRSLLKKNKK
ncbi:MULTISPECIES: hypothetical protein [Enterococcus]|uniref:Uncharacterized protein n=1 Tax=Enterococcus mundtii TaxID=53346 RepID=A0AAI8RCG7_ENTMU|nr:hypothetical protein [Enterococcus mundtii]MBE9911490.1 hypothetical protein [Enterococcus mundtii]MCA6774368.1 hypothetical protein [Enterococcus mundtii]UBM06406.1 hypothetical protein K9N66_04430 [Enterococcus mundtii]BAO06856.1 hypothetical protein EMQU_1299 [Enterococcus mundtii QU 25]BBM16158.1 uncharacterized protein EM151A_2998 [Enterococcus mundtii]